MTLLGTVYAVGYLQPYFDAGRNGGPHFALLNMTSLSFVLIYSVQNALVFLLGWEIAAVAAWLLVIWDYRNQKIRFAGFNYLVSTHVGLFVLVAAFMLLHGKTGSMDFRAFGAVLAKPGRAARRRPSCCSASSFALKSAFFPFHTWLPRAHSAAPAHVSALMSGVIHKAGLFAFLRFTLLMGKPEEWMGWTVLVFGAALGVLRRALHVDAARPEATARLLVDRERRHRGDGLRRRLPRAGRGAARRSSSLGFAGGLLHILNHALFKCLLFYAAGAVYRATHTVDLERLGGLLRRMPRTAVALPARRPRDLGAAAAQRLHQRVHHLLGPAVGRGAVGRRPTRRSSRAAALLAFVGAVSALSMTRAFGVAFLGRPRDASVHVTTARRRSRCASRCRCTRWASCVARPVPGGRARADRAAAARAASPAAGARRRDASVARAARAGPGRACAVLVALAADRPAWSAGCVGPARAQARHLGLRLHGGEHAHAVHRELLLRAVRAASSRRSCPQLRRERLPHELFPAEPGTSARTTSTPSSGGCSRCSARASRWSRRPPSASPSSRGSRSRRA